SAIRVVGPKRARGRKGDSLGRSTLQLSQGTLALELLVFICPSSPVLPITTVMLARDGWLSGMGRAEVGPTIARPQEDGLHADPVSLRPAGELRYRPGLTWPTWARTWAGYCGRALTCCLGGKRRGKV